MNCEVKIVMRVSRPNPGGGKEGENLWEDELWPTWRGKEYPVAYLTSFGCGNEGLVRKKESQKVGRAVL